MFALIKLNVYSVQQQEKSKISSTIFNFIDCASYPRIDYAAQSERDKLDYQHLNFSFIQLNALMTRIAKKNDLRIDERESALTKLLYPIRQSRQDVALQHTSPPHSVYADMDACTADEHGKLLVMINCTLDASLRAETMATLRFGNLPTVDPFILGMMEKQRHRIKKLESKSKELKIKIKCYKKERKQLQAAAVHGHNASASSSASSLHLQQQQLEKERYCKERQQLTASVNHLNEVIALLRAENEELMKKFTQHDRDTFDVQNKYDKLQSDHELLKLDFASIKKELSAQKNHNFWLMEDYSELKRKYEQCCANTTGSATASALQSKCTTASSDQIGTLLQEIRTLREETRENEVLLKKADHQCKAYEDEIRSLQSAHKKQLNAFMVEIKERDEQINELGKEIESRDGQTVKEHEMMRRDRKIYENYIQDLEETLKSHHISLDSTRSKHANGKPSIKPKNKTDSSGQEQKNGHDDEEEEDAQHTIRKLRMEIIKYKTDMNSSSVVQKLRDNKHKLEEKVIKLRTDKAKQIMAFNEEKHKLQAEINRLQTQLNNANAIRKWVRLVHKQQLLTVAKDIERANRKMKENYSQNNEFREQMHVLRKIAEQKFNHALQHQMNRNLQINANYTPSPSHRNSTQMQLQQQIQFELTGAIRLEPYKSAASSVTLYPDEDASAHHQTNPSSNNNMFYEQLAIESATDFEHQLVGLLPENLKKIHEVIDRLTNKLMIKNGQLHELRAQYDALQRSHKQLECGVNDDSNPSLINRGQTMSSSTNHTIPTTPPLPSHDSNEANNEDADDDDEHDEEQKQVGHVISNSGFDTYLPNILDKLNINVREMEEQAQRPVRRQPHKTPNSHSTQKRSTKTPDDSYVMQYEHRYQDEDEEEDEDHDIILAQPTPDADEEEEEDDEDDEDEDNDGGEDDESESLEDSKGDTGQQEAQMATFLLRKQRQALKQRRGAASATTSPIIKHSKSALSSTTMSDEDGLGDIILPPSRNPLKSSKSYTTTTPNLKRFGMRGRALSQLPNSTTDLYGNRSTSSLFANGDASTSNVLCKLNDLEQTDADNKRKQRQLRLLQQSLSITFHIDNRKNTRMQLNVSMSPRDVYHEMCNGLINEEMRDKQFALIIQHNISPEFERIVIPFENTKMSFWELIVEFGIMNLLHFNICCDDNLEKYLDADSGEERSKSSYAPKMKVKTKKSSKKRRDKERRRSGSFLNIFSKK